MEINIGRADHLKWYKKLMKDGGYEVIHLKSVSSKKLEDTIKLFKKHFHFEDVIFILRGKTTSRTLRR